MQITLLRYRKSQEYEIDSDYKTPNQPEKVTKH